MGLVLVGGFAGFWLALLGYLAFGLPPLAALAIWALSGPLGAILALLILPLRGVGAEASRPASLPRPA